MSSVKLMLTKNIAVCEFWVKLNELLLDIVLGLSESCIIVKLGSRSKVYLKSLIRDLDLELVAIIAMSPTTTTQETFLSRITLKSLHV